MPNWLVVNQPLSKITRWLDNRAAGQPWKHVAGISAVHKPQFMSTRPSLNQAAQLAYCGSMN